MLNLLTVFVLTHLLGSPLPPDSTSSEKPNVVFILVDDLNTWIGAMQGHPDAYTPNIDRLAARGALFTQAHCQAPICGPSRASFLSGLLPSTSGIYGQIKDHQLREDNTTMQQATFLPEYFEQQGYLTMGVGKIYHNGDGAKTFQEYGGLADYGPKPEKRFHYDPEWFGKPAGTQTDWGAFPNSDTDMPDYQIANWAIEKLSESYDKPFFLTVGFIRPHVPLHVPSHWFSYVDLDSLELPMYLPNDTEDVPDIARRITDMPKMPTTEWALKYRQYENITQAYLACVTFVDHQIGRVLDRLEASSYADNTLVVLASDHGYHVGEKNRFAKHSLWERATHVPLVVARPSIPEGIRRTSPVGLIDIYPTLLDYCSFPPNPQNEGHSLLPLLATEDAERAALTTYGRNNHSIFANDWHYIRYEDGSEELYSLSQDPNEWKNLALEKKYEAVKSDIRNFLPNRNAPEAEGSYLHVDKYFRSKK